MRLKVDNELHNVNKVLHDGNHLYFYAHFGLFTIFNSSKEYILCLYEEMCEKGYLSVSSDSNISVKYKPF